MEIPRPGYPQVYSTFEVMNELTNKVDEYKIQDLTEEFFDQAVDFLVENHARGAVFHRAAKTLCNEKGVERVQNYYRNVINERISLICLKVGTNEIAGMNALYTYIVSKTDQPEKEASTQKKNKQPCKELSNLIEMNIAGRGSKLQIIIYPYAIYHKPVQCLWLLSG